MRKHVIRQKVATWFLHLEKKSHGIWQQVRTQSSPLKKSYDKAKGNNSILTFENKRSKKQELILTCELKSHGEAKGKNLILTFEKKITHVKAKGKNSILLKNKWQSKEKSNNSIFTLRKSHGEEKGKNQVLTYQKIT